MGLCNLYEYQNTKTVKLSDSYSVELWLDKDDFSTANTPANKKDKVLNLETVPENYKLVLFNCTDVTLPAFKYKPEIYKYGNNEKTFLVPDYSSLDDVTIELMEYYDNNDNLVVQQLVNLFLNKIFDPETFTYKMHDYIKQLEIKVYNNNFSSLIYVYRFKNLKLTNYTKYDLDYSSANPAKWKLTFSYMEYQAIPEANYDYNVNTVITPEERKAAVEERNKEFADMYAAAMQGRGTRAPSESSSMLLPNAYNNNNETNTIEQKTAMAKANELRKSIEAQQNQIETVKDVIADIENKLNEAKAKQAELAAQVDEKQTAYQENVNKTQGILQQMESNEKFKDSKYWGFKYKEHENRYNENMDARKETNAALALARNELSAQDAIVKEYENELKAQKQILTDMNAGFEHLKEERNAYLNKAESLNDYKNDQVKSLENRYGSIESIEQRNKSAQSLSYAQSMSQTVEPTEEEQLHTGANNLASTLWNNQNINDELHAINEANKIDMNSLNIESDDETKMTASQEVRKELFSNSTAGKILKETESMPAKTEEPKAESKIETVFTRSDKILALTEEYEKTHPEWSDAYIYEHASNVVDKELGLVETVEAPKKETKSAKTIISSYLNNDNVAGKDVVSQGMIDEINSSSRSRAETVEFKPKSVEELKAGIDKFTNPNDESLYVVSVDPSKISGLTRWGIKTAGGDEAEKFLDNGYSFTIYKGNVNGVGNINTQKDAWLNQFSDYEFFANRILQNGGVEFKVAKITPKNDN